MKTVFTILFFTLTNILCIAQCSTVSVQVSSSDTNYVQLYNAGFFNIPSGFDNVCQWEVISFTGDTIYQETTSGDFNDQSSVIFDHEISITDSMKASILITNNTEGIICTMNDTLYWKETEVLPGVFVGNWDVLSSNGGVEEDISTATKVIVDSHNIEIFPSPSLGQFWVRSDAATHSFTILDFNGMSIASYRDVGEYQTIDISQYSSGLYVLHFWDEKGNRIGVEKIVKL